LAKPRLKLTAEGAKGAKKTKNLTTDPRPAGTGDADDTENTEKS